MTETYAPSVILNDGITMPMVGFGTAHLNDHAAARYVSEAFVAGYRKVDTGAIYGNEIGVGEAIAASGLPREQVWVTTKVWNDDQGSARTRAALSASLERLGLDYVDLYLVHWPAPARGLFIETYQTLEQLRAEGLVRSIGVSNFEEHHIVTLLDAGVSIPSVNQVQLHPYLQEAPLRALHAEHHIRTEAWSPLAQGEILGDPVLTAIAHRHGATPAQVVLGWHLAHGISVVPRTQHSERIPANLAAVDVRLTEEDISAIDQLDQGYRIGPPADEVD